MTGITISNPGQIDRDDQTPGDRGQVEEALNDPKKDLSRGLP
jgi:hypothetical protein